MFPISFLLVLFLFQLSVGCMVTLAMMPLQEVDRKFYQLSSGLSSILVAVGLGLAWYYPLELPQNFGAVSAVQQQWSQAATMAFLVYGLVIFFLYVRMRRDKLGGAKAWVRVGAILGALALALEGMAFRPEGLQGGLKGLLLSVDFLTAAWFLGVFLLAMVFGHWYLVKSMPKKLLRRMAEILIVVLVLRVLVVAGTLWFFSVKVPGGAESIQWLMDIERGHGMFFWQRLLVGLGIPLVLSYMIWSTAKIGANQSATGLLYVGVVFVMIGEMLSKYMFMMSGIPL